MKSKAEKNDFIEEPSLPPKRQIPNYRTLEQYFDVQGLASKSLAYHLSDVRENFRLIYFEVLDSSISVINKEIQTAKFPILHEDGILPSEGNR